MKYVNEILTEQVAKMKEEIYELNEELKRMKFDAKIENEQKDVKLDNLEKTNLDATNSLEDVTAAV